MTRHSGGRIAKHNCKNCPLLTIEHFRKFTGPELDFMQRFKIGELNTDPGATIFAEGSHSAHLFTVLSGWVFRYKTLEDGRRQIMNYALPGDLIGLQGSLMHEMQHSVETLTPVELCMFERDRLIELYNKYPSLAFDITWMAAHEERILDEHLLSVGRRSSLERAAYLLVYLNHRARRRRTGGRGGPVTLPVTQQHVADTLGLSLVHTNKTLKKLADGGHIKWLERGCRVLDEAELSAIAQWTPEDIEDRPYI